MLTGTASHTVPAGQWPAPDNADVNWGQGSGGSPVTGRHTSAPRSGADGERDVNLGDAVDETAEPVGGMPAGPGRPRELRGVRGPVALEGVGEVGEAGAAGVG
ncbi:hypothetical protein [Streptomyces camelliae]|uniref:hypothetical protein n=1 Tax=Streptomyces camelliae TaxID=3004093 RepID=UPI002FD81FBD